MAIVDTEDDWVDPRMIPDSMPIYNIPFEADGLNIEEVQKGQVEEFSDGIEEAKNEESDFEIYQGLLYSTRPPTHAEPEYPRLMLPRQFREKVIENCHKNVGHMVETHSLKSLHTILSTGSPLKPLTYEYVYRDIKKDLLLGSITGGTDIISCFAGQNCTLPVYRGEIQARNLGMAVECWNEDEKPVFGESGELVCTKPFPSMPTYFWNDEDGLKCKKAYFDKFKGKLNDMINTVL
ncbi:acetoacetyl-CoA synthetase-like [Lingula anatina]|uniref:Acetoacetyl-CoA synthetase-like n=1 Tax=Lingula anatina TaxID=7574 RepID=A0A1S3IH30_LINAN|nr:acetoacetyl-CoA synthetase-like [Lingula anatina]|eukprot:XP_013397438.1 acetoacetyl-CoA synthetase-like [Lingula anatina]